MLDLRYNEMWNDWDGSTSDDKFRSPDGKPYAHPQQLVLSWKRLNVSVKTVSQKFFSPSKIVYKQILYNVSGNAQCGSLLGIMGSSGSGKTTLMSTISHRTKGNFNGQLTLNGQPVSENAMIQMSGFVPQHDVSFDRLTALEHLTLMAKLKTDRNTTRTVQTELVDRIVSSLAMSKFADTRISFLSGGERKKVALAVQLVNDPPILFCDEITTGLDSYSAAHIVNMLKNVARTGKIVVCTIHQPASGVFRMFDDVVLLTDGRLAYHGPVTMVNQLFQKFNYECPNMFNEADYVISILNSDKEAVKRDVAEMCKLSSTDQQTNFVCDTFNSQKLLDCMDYLQKQNPRWTTQFTLILGRSIKCFFRDYQTNLLDFGNTLFLAILLATPYASLQFDTKAVQNWEGFWLVLVVNFVFYYCYSAIAFYHEQFSIVHREVHNKLYPFSVYYVSEILIMIVWIMIKTVFYCISAFTIVGAEWNHREILVFFVLGVSAFSSGSLLSSFVENLDNTILLATTYNFISLPLSGVYRSFKALPIPLYLLRYFSIFFLGCETVSILFWEKIKSIPCIEPNNCLDSGRAVLNKYGYIIEEFNFDLMIMISFSVIAIIVCYFGVLSKLKKQPAY